MKRKFRSFARRLTTRIVLTVLGVMTVTASLLTVISLIVVGVLVNDHFMSVVDMANDKIDLWLSSLQVSSANISDEVGYNLQTPGRVTAALSDELRLNPIVTGVGMGFVSNYFPGKGHWYEPYAVRDSLGRIFVKEIGSEKHDYFKAEWYTAALQKDGPHWSAPYIDEEGANSLLITYSVPIRNVYGKDQKPVGVLGTDLNLAWLQAQMARIDQNENNRSFAVEESAPKHAHLKIYSFILGPEGRYIVHPETSRILHNTFFDYIPEKGAESYRRAGEEMLAGHSGYVGTRVNGERALVFYAPLESTGWSMGIVVPFVNIFLPGSIVGFLILLLISIGCVVIFLVSSLSIRQATQPLKSLAASTGEIARGNFDTPLPTIRSKDEIGLLRDSFEDMQHSLAHYVDELTATTAQKASIERELNIARSIQMAMLPTTFPPYPGAQNISIYASLTPARTVGGDLYDILVQDGRLYFCIGDVSGKGIPASLVMAGASMQFRALATRELHPDKLVSAFNQSMCARNESLMFITFFTGVLDLQSGELAYCNAGHDAPVLVSGGQPALLDTISNVPVGLEADWSFQCQTTRLSPGTTLFLYTDGLTEAENVRQELFGRERMLQCLSSFSGESPEELVGSISQAVHTFTEGAEQSDDLTFLAIRFNG